MMTRIPSLSLSALLLLPLSSVVMGGETVVDKVALGSNLAAEDNPITRPMTLSEKIKLQKSYASEPTFPGMGIDDRVVGGSPVTSQSEYPFFVEWESAACGASLIHDDIALSAAHCESRTNPFSTRVFINGLTSAGGVFRNVAQQLSHPLYNGDDKDYDFMILKLDSSGLVNPDGSSTGASLVTINEDSDNPQPGDPLMAVGFGLTEEGNQQTSSVLNDVEVLYVDDDQCMSQYGSGTYVPDLMFCAGVSGGGKDTCQGDSGGPILDANDKQVGVVSFGIGCARATHNGVYARVSAVSEWIQDMVCQLSDDPPAGCKNKPAQNGNGDVTITMNYDSYPKETGIVFVMEAPEPAKGLDDGVDQVLFFQPYQHSNANNMEVKEFNFPNLKKGDYRLLVGDQGRDGNCCAYGQGSFSITDNNNNVVVHTNDGQFGEFVQVNINVAPNGDVTFISETANYDNSWEGADAIPNYPQAVDQAWPGPVPLQLGGLNINIKFDRYPAENTWTFAKRNGNSANFNVIESFDGATLGKSNDMVSTQLGTIDEGWYRLVIEDVGADGFCCNFRRGWASITGYILSTRKSGLVWGTNGEIGSSITVYLEMNAEGYIKKITDDLSTI
ncbi:Transmembrane protease serine [Seminavis robusta]|uniref:Transmembrane protease serine n=1 Tax=Seminavis robusta TaxID=568900 RepID=A0A9N8DPN9_9STRA|nr:Transmembrane protease serine [Seminavis robusta]|eukprot:Sro201_g085040.1 Transmembrane protease serine (614) ;mRNA; r:35394-37427